MAGRDFICLERRSTCYSSAPFCETPVSAFAPGALMTLSFRR